MPPSRLDRPHPAAVWCRDHWGVGVGLGWDGWGGTQRGEMRNISKFAVGLEKLSSLKENFTWNGCRHQNAYGDISSLPLRAPLKGAGVFTNTKGADTPACVHAEIDKSFIAPRSRQKLCLCCQMASFFFFYPSSLLHLFKTAFFSVSTADGKVI